MNKMIDLVSIIVPIYNSKKYLNKCLDGLVNQSYKNIEIILVDDGSNDGSELICDEYRNYYNNIKVIHKSNTGTSGARNEGIRKASGKWIMFCDSDDWYEIDAVKTLTSKAENEKTLVIGNIEIQFTNKQSDVVRTIRNDSIDIKLDNNNIKDKFDFFFKSVNTSSACAKLYLKEIIDKNKICFNEQQSMLEDMEFLYKYAQHVSTIINTHEVVYVYNALDDINYMEKRNKQDLFEDIKSTYVAVNEYINLKQINSKEIRLFFMNQFMANIDMIHNSKALTYKEKKERILNCVKYIKQENINKYFDINGLSRTNQALIYKEDYLLYTINALLKKIKNSII